MPQKDTHDHWSPTPGNPPDTGIRGVSLALRLPSSSQQVSQEQDPKRVIQKAVTFPGQGFSKHFQPPPTQGSEAQNWSAERVEELEDDAGECHEMLSSGMTHH